MPRESHGAAAVDREDMSLDAADQANQRMVDRLIAEGALWSRPLIVTFRVTPRHRFLDRVFIYQRKHSRWREIITRDPGPDELRILYADRALITHISPTGRDEPSMPISSSSQPSLMAQMLEDLRPHPGQRVLEIGAGTGYNAALMAAVVGPGRVTSIDVDREVLSQAWDHLRAFPERPVELAHADGREGYVERQPYDRIMVTAATPDIEPAWLEQLAPDGLLLAPLAIAPGLAYVVRGSVKDGILQARLTRAAYFMPLRAEGEAGPAEVLDLPPTGELRLIPAPWAEWFDRGRPRSSWVGFSQALAFYGWLRGLTLHYQALAGGEVTYGISQDERLCWLGRAQWYVTDGGGQELGQQHWQAFLRAGGPRPTEFSLLADPSGRLPLDGPESYAHKGSRCQQVWTLMAERERMAWL